MIDIYKKHQDSGDLLKTPHPFAVSSRAYVRMVSRLKPQSLLCCGISGAGKSECAKQLIRYLAKTSPMGEGMVTDDPDFIVNQIVQASIILEAWGNAKTTLNNNSSRFGKFVKLMYKDGAILGSWMETYLLEKSRVIMQGPAERNYHIFYFMMKGLSQGQLDSMNVGKASDFWYLKQGGSTDVDGIDDKECYQELMDSLKLYRFNEKDLSAIWSLTAGIMHLGQCGMKEDDGGNATVDPSNKINLDMAADLWGISSDSLNTRLTTASMEVMKKTIIKKVAPSKFNDNRDAISKALFENSFLFVVERINGELFHLGNGDVRKIMFIGVLDIFGFENFITNSIEQFCINFTNEKIQGFFNYNIIQSEQEEYIKESVLWTPMEVPDNSDFVEMIEDKKAGMFALLDSACKAPKPSPETFVSEFFKKQGKMKKYLEKCKQPKGMKKKKKKKGKKGRGGEWVGFVIHHFCDDVIYTCNLFLDKNMDAIHPDTAKMYTASKMPLVQMIGAGTHHKKKRKKKKKASVCSFFKSQLVNLMSTLNITEPYFCRAMKPNWNKSKSEWDNVLVEDQLRSGGMIEALRVLKLGYPTRVPYKKIWDKFNGKIQNPLINNLDQMGFAEAVLMAFDVDSSWYCLGLTKIFFKPSKAACLDEIMKASGRPLTADQNAKITEFVKQKRMKQLIGACKIFLKLSLRIRFKRARANLEKMGRVLGMIAQTIVRHADYAKNILKIKAAQTIQSYFRGKNLAKTAVPKVNEKKLHSVKVFHMWRRYEERTKLMQWLVENCDAAKKRAEELKSMSPAERAEREEKRKAARIAAAAKAAEDAAMDAANKEAAAADADSAAAAAREAAMSAQNANAGNMEDADKIARAAEAKRKEVLRLASEKAQRDKENSELWKLLHPQSSGEEEDYEDETGAHHVRKVHEFKRECSFGHIFTVYHKRKNRSPHERFVRIDWDGGEPQNINWGGGPTRTIPMSEIKFVLKGRKTPTMQLWKEDSEEDHVFSVIGDKRTFDCQAADQFCRDEWVNGITKLLGQTEEERYAAQEAYDPSSSVVQEIVKPDAKTPSQLDTQRGLFNMQVKTTFRELSYEGLYVNIPADVKEDFQSDKFYQKCLQGGTEWRQWEQWIRDEIVKFLVDNGLVDGSVAEMQEQKIKENKAAGNVPPDVKPLTEDCLIC